MKLTLKKSLLLLPLFIFLIACVGGCASAAKLNDIRIGMSKSEVISLLGKPDSMSAQGSIEYLTYYLVADQGGVNGRAYDQPYAVRLVDGKVESFGRFAQLFDIYNRPVGGNSMGVQPMPMYGTSQTYAVPQPPMGGSATPDIAGQLLKLKTLKDQGVLTDEEFQKAKQMLLNGQK